MDSYTQIPTSFTTLNGFSATYLNETREALHLGSAYLILDMEADTLKGEYWTKRSWRSGLNTAGMLEVTRV